MRYHLGIFITYISTTGYVTYRLLTSILTKNNDYIMHKLLCIILFILYGIFVDAFWYAVAHSHCNLWYWTKFISLFGIVMLCKSILPQVKTCYDIYEDDIRFLEGNLVKQTKKNDDIDENEVVDETSLI